LQSSVGGAVLAASQAPVADAVEMFCYVGEENVFGIVEVLAIVGVLGIMALVCAIFCMCLCVQQKSVVSPPPVVETESVQTETEPVRKEYPLRVETVILPDQIHICATVARFPRSYHTDRDCRQLQHADAPVKSAYLCETCRKGHDGRRTVTFSCTE
jgi:hypothetical protein